MLGGLVSEEAACSAGDLGSVPESGRPLEKGMATHSSVLAEKSHVLRSLVGRRVDTTEQLTSTFITS